MKHFNKLRNTTLLATTLAVALFASQSAMAGEEGIADEYSGHAHATSSNTSSMKNCMKNQRVNYALQDNSVEDSSLSNGMFPEPEH